MNDKDRVLMMLARQIESYIMHETSGKYEYPLKYSRFGELCNVRYSMLAMQLLTFCALGGYLNLDIGKLF